MNQLWAAEERIGMIDQELVELQKEKRQLDKQLDRITPENNQEKSKISLVVFKGVVVVFLDDPRHFSWPFSAPARPITPKKY